MQRLGEPHVRSFNYFINKGLSQIVDDLIPVEFVLNDQRIKLTVTNYSLSNPQVPLGTIAVKSTFVFPTECRQRGATYKGKLYVDVDWFIDDVRQQPFQKDLGDIPIMVKVKHILYICRNCY